MRDLVVREAITAMAEDAAERFRELIGAGAEVPYDVHEAGGGSLVPQYVPLTERFVRENAAGLRELDSFGTACAALEASGVSDAYLERMGVAAPPEPRRRAELACVVFLCRLWSESTDFSLSDDRLAPAVEELEIGTEVLDDEIEVIVPLRGLHMPVVRLELATATIVRADTVEVPPEARIPEGSGAAAWEPAFIAVALVSEIDRDGGDDGAPDAGARAVEAFRQVITALRLFKQGGVALGPHAWARSGNDRWRRIATGAGRPRPGGYRLTEDEVNEVVAFSRSLAQRSTPFGAPVNDRRGLAKALPRAISRFEAGLERNAVLEALNDHLLAARFLLEGGGPADLGLSMRIAALCAEPERRDATKAIVDRALVLERELWAGEPARSNGDAPTAAETAMDVEELVRAILKDAACGHLGSDLRVTADEILLADGLAVGEGAPGQRGETAEWDPSTSEELVAPVYEMDAVPGGQEAEMLIAAYEAEDVEDGDVEWGDPDEAPVDDEGLKVPEIAGRISIERTVQPQEEEIMSASPAPAYEPETRQMQVPPHEEEPSRAEQLLAARPAEREKIADRVAHLFPRPETTEWTVREVAYDRTRRARVS